MNADAERFLALLDPDATAFTFQTFDDVKGRGDVGLARVIHGSLADHYAELVRLNHRGAGIFITINETDFRGRRAENIIRVRCLFVDLDGAPLPTHGPKPHIVVETSPQRWHCYWRVAGIALDEFAARQRALIATFAADPAVCDLPRVMRLPGFLHRKGEPRLVRIASTTNGPAYSAADFPAPIKVETPRRPSTALTADEGRIARALAFIPNVELDWKAWCDLGLAIYSATGGSEGGFRMFDAWSQRATKYDAGFTARTWDGFARSPPERIGFGTIYHTASRANPKWARLLDDDDPKAKAIAAAFLDGVRND